MPNHEVCEETLQLAKSRRFILIRETHALCRVEIPAINLPEQVVHNKNNIPPRVDFLNYKPQVKSAIYTQLTLQAVMLIFRFDPRKLEDLWDGDDFVAKWV